MVTSSLTERSSPDAVDSSCSLQNQSAIVQHDSPFLRLPGELRNRIYGTIIEQCPSSRNRVYMGNGRKLHKKRPLDIGAVHPTRARPYMGLAQTCQLLRKEFRPLYLGAMRFSGRFGALSGALDLFGPADMKQDLEPILKDLAQIPLPDAGIDLFELIEKIESHQDRWKLSSGGDNRLPTHSLVGVFIYNWINIRNGTRVNLRQMTEMRLHHKLVDGSESSLGGPKYVHVIRITIPAGATATHSASMADSTGNLFIKTAHLHHSDPYVLETYSGDCMVSKEAKRSFW